MCSNGTRARLCSIMASEQQQPHIQWQLKRHIRTEQAPKNISHCNILPACAARARSILPLGWRLAKKYIFIYLPMICASSLARLTLYINALHLLQCLSKMVSVFLFVSNSSHPHTVSIFYPLSIALCTEWPSQAFSEAHHPDSTESQAFCNTNTVSL